MTADPGIAAVLERIDEMTDEGGGGAEPTAPDRRDGRVYRTSEDLRVALKLAIVTRRPLLLRGVPGSGKSSLAAYVARNLGWRYYEHVLTSRTQARDLLWSYDVVRRFADAASGKQDLNDHDYVEPGVLWWVMNPETARQRGDPQPRKPQNCLVDPTEGVADTGRTGDAVVLLDEIDKADPDVPNALLVPLGSTRFEVAETGTVVTLPTEGDTATTAPPRMLVIVTTNEERELPEAFIRRCIVHRLRHPKKQELVEIARAHLKARGMKLNGADLERVETIADRVKELRRQSLALGRRPPSTAEFLDAVFVSRTLKIAADDWDLIEGLVLAKGRLDTGTPDEEEDEDDEEGGEP